MPDRLVDLKTTTEELENTVDTPSGSCYMGFPNDNTVVSWFQCEEYVKNQIKNDRKWDEKQIENLARMRDDFRKSGIDVDKATKRAEPIIHKAYKFADKYGPQATKALGKAIDRASEGTVED